MFSYDLATLNKENWYLIMIHASVHPISSTSPSSSPSSSSLSRVFQASSSLVTVSSSSWVIP